MNVTEAKTLTNASPGPVTLKGGRYTFNVAAAAFSNGSVALQALMPDGVTYATVMTLNGSPASLSGPGSMLVDLSPGQYMVQIQSATGVQATIASVPS